MSAERIFVSPGEVFFGQGDCYVETLLGSCVAIVFWHAEQGLGGLCHFLLPARQRQGRKENGQEDVELPLDGRYGEDALRQLLAEIKRHKTRVADYEVKVFGGSRTMDTVLLQKPVGQANAQFALDILKQHKIPIAAQDIEGDGYRYLRFDLNTGDVWVRRGRGTLKKEEAKRAESGGPG
ncbi:chemotaxis protein CheD [Herbaspirillum lusitanum]|jgi:chemotaxis protein CheD|uniref:Probable chemoreceptor glutamine deamidase CheD n=1 Tax=Herbaspirillum lusitanum TaxID=213312 RepID=A0ABW9A868_9BURK